jgi:glycylpeptide N-tetradecanoyltransferase
LEGDNEAFEPNKPVDQVQQEPFKLNDLFEWSDVNIEVPDELDELYNLLYENYVEDDDNMFRFDYSKDFLLWYAPRPHCPHDCTPGGPGGPLTW